MKNQRQSICSIIDDNNDNSYYYDSKKQIKLNQTSINNFFLSTTSSKTVQQLHRGMKRPISADSSSSTLSTLSSCPSSKTQKDCLTSTGIKEDTVVTNDTNDQVILQNITNQKKRQKISSSLLLSENINQSNSKLRSQQKQKQQSQLYIDFGQTNFASTNICSICNMLFVHGIQSDIQQHYKICSNYINGVLWNIPTKKQQQQKQKQQQRPISNSSSSSFDSCLPIHNRKCNSLQQQHQQRVCYEWVVSHNNKHNSNNNSTTTTTTKLNQQTITYPIQQQQQSNVILKWNNKNLSMMNKSQQQQHASIIELRPNNIGIYTNQNKLNLVRQIVNEELGFVQDDYNNNTNKNHNQQIIYLCIMNKRVAGMVIVEEISKAYQLLEEDNTSINDTIDNTNTSSTIGSLSSSSSKPSTTTTCNNNIGFTRSIQPCKAILGIYQLWVHTKYRNCNIASTLIDTVRKHMYYGYNNIPIEHIAFSSPTEAGIQFAKRYNSKHNHPNVLVYDCC